MGVHLVGDTIAKLSTLRGMLEKRYTLKTELLSHADLLGQDIEAVVIAADLRDVENITALKEISPKLARIPKRIFLIDRKSRLSTVQAYALGATSVLSNTVNRTQLLARGHAIRRGLRQGGVHLLLQPGDADLEELVDVFAQDRQEPYPLEQGQ